MEEEDLSVSSFFVWLGCSFCFGEGAVVDKVTKVVASIHGCVYLLFFFQKKKSFKVERDLYLGRRGIDYLLTSIPEPLST